MPQTQPQDMNASSRHFNAVLSLGIFIQQMALLYRNTTYILLLDICRTISSMFTYVFIVTKHFMPGNV